MEKVIVNPDTRGKLRNLNQWLELCDEDGQVLGYFTPAPQEPLECPLSVRSSDTAAYVLDAAPCTPRVVRVKLSYAAEETCALP